MWYLIPTQRGLGVELWGTYDDLYNLHFIIGKFWNKEEFSNQTGFTSRDNVLSGFSYEIRKAREGNRLVREESHFSLEKINHYGTQISWVHFLFSMAALRKNLQHLEADKFDLSILLQMEYWVVHAAKQLDLKTGEVIEGFLEGIDGSNQYIYQYMRSINFDYFLLGGGLKNFKMLPKLLRRGVIFTDDYSNYLTFLTAEAKRMNCSINAIEVDDDAFDYEVLKW